jgi:C4-dicarboxylate transporter
MILDNIQAFKSQFNKINTFKEGIAAKEENIKKLIEGSVVFIKSLKKVGIDYKLITLSHIKIKIKQLINESLNVTAAYLACLEALRGPTPE